MQPSEEIKSRLDIIDVLREYIQLKPAGVNFRSLCPFHREKSPSFVVSPEKQIWHCFGCGKGGDIFAFVMEMEGLSFVEALKALAPKAGVELKKQDPALTSKRNRLIDIVDLSRKYYHELLINSPLAQGARQYLSNRGLKNETIEEWSIGYSADSWDDLNIFLKGKGYKDEEIFASGMSVKKEGSNRFYNRFRGRIMFPIFDINGNAVAFSARVSPEKEAEEKMGKYINSPQTLIYDKSKIIFGLDKAKQEIKNNDLAILVEGQMDVITAHQNGFKNVVASSGTALTLEQVVLLKRYSNNIALAFDADKAGEMAADRGMVAASEAEMNIKVIEIPNGKDPDECIKNSPEEWRASVSDAKPMMEYVFEKKLNNLDLSEAENKREAVRRILPVLYKMRNKIEQDFWLKKLGERIDVKEDLLRESLVNIKPSSYVVKNESVIAPKEERKNIERDEAISEIMLAILLRFPQLIEYAANHVLSECVVGDKVLSLYRNLLVYYNNIVNDLNAQGSELDVISHVNYNGFRDFLISIEYNQIGGEKEDQLKMLDKLVILGDRDFADHDDISARNEFMKMSGFLKRNFLVKRMKEIERMIVEAEKNGDENNLKAFLEEFKYLTDEIHG